MKTLCSLLTAILLLASLSLAQSDKKTSAPTRSVTGIVTDAADKPVQFAMVQLKDMKTKTIRSFSSQQNGTYYFQNLSPDIEYELSATFEGATSNTRTLSTFDSRKEAVINLKLNPKK
jgi:hypothetical protein